MEINILITKPPRIITLGRKTRYHISATSCAAVKSDELMTKRKCWPEGTVLPGIHRQQRRLSVTTTASYRSPSPCFPFDLYNIYVR